MEAYEKENFLHTTERKVRRSIPSMASWRWHVPILSRNGCTCQFGQNSNGGSSALTSTSEKVLTSLPSVMCVRTSVFLFPPKLPKAAKSLLA